MNESFNPRPREGGDIYSSSFRHQQVGFQSTPPRRGRRIKRCCVSSLSCFNPRPREGGDNKPKPPKYQVLVSIHAPAKGATQGILAISVSKKVSIHAPAKGATQSLGVISWQDAGFNPRPREGGDISISRCFHNHRGFNPRPREGGDPCFKPHRSSAQVSIHAPAKGATIRRFEDVSLLEFQSTPPRRGRREEGR